MKAGMILKKIGLYALVLLIVFIIAFPIYAVLYNSFQYDKDIRNKNRGIVPSYITMENYEEVMSEGHVVPIKEATVTSLYVSLLAAALSVIIAVPAAYALSRNKLKSGKVLLLGLSANYVLPSMLMLLPIFVLFVRMHANDSPFTVMLLYTSFMTPLLISVIKAFVEAVPEEVEQAARLDGCSHLRLFVKLYLPVMKPGIASAFLYAFVLSWIEFLTPLIFTSKTKMLTTALGLYHGTQKIAIGQMSAAAVIAMLPVVVVTAVFAPMITQVMTGAEKK